jgi:DNA-binding beta-propeller fold protein YncE
LIMRHIAIAALLPLSLAACQDTTQPVALPGQLQTVAEAAGQPLAFVADRSSGSVKVFNRDTRSLLKEIPVGTRPTTLAVSPDERLLYVTVTGSRPLSRVEDGSLSVISLADLSLAMTTPVGFAPWGIVTSPDGVTAYVSDAGDAAVHVLKLSDRSLVQTIRSPFLDTPQGMAVTPDGAFVYVANVAFVNANVGLPKAPENVTVIRTADHSVTGIDVSARVRNFGPWDVTILPDGKKAYSNDGDNGTSLFEIDADPTSPTFNDVTEQIGLGGFNNGPRGMESGVTGDGVRVFAALAESYEVVVLDPANDQVVRRVSVDAGSFPWRVRLTPDGSELWVSLRDRGEILILDTDTYQETARIEGFVSPADIAFTRVLAPNERVDALSRQVGELRDLDIVNDGQANALLSTLSAVATQLERGNDRAATKVLEAFINQVEAFVKVGILSLDDGRTLIDSAHAVIAQLTG